MAQTRKDLRGRALRKGESQRRSDGRYVYTYTDPLGRRKYVYAQDLVTLREKEAQLMKDQMDGLDIYVAGKATINFVFDRYMSLKNNLKPTTKSNYLYMYDRFIRETFGKRNIAEIKYSDVVQFYNHLIEKQELKINTLETIHTLLHPTFQLAVRDDIIRKNPTDGVMAELKKNLGMKTGVRHALTIPQQRAFMEYIATHPVYFHWWPIFTIFLGTGCRIGEVLGLRWEDIDYEKRIISINHNLTYYPVGEDRASENHISTPKTEAGMRTIPMLDTVKDAFEMIWEEQKENGWTDAEIDGMTGFVFCNRYGNIMNAQSVNRAIKRISSAYNATEEIEAKKEHREPVLLPDFSAHSLRHTFCTSLEPIHELCNIAHRNGAKFHTDAVQAVGHVKIDVKEIGVDMMSASAHKFNGPKGIGFLYVKTGTALKPFADGGAQEYGMRAGTENVAGIVAMSVALKKACSHIDDRRKHLLKLEDLLLQGLKKYNTDFIRNGSSNRVPGNISLSFKNANGEMLLHRLDLMGIMVSTGSACDSTNTQMSHVLKAIKIPEEYGFGTIRISFNHENTEEDAKYIAESIGKILTTVTKAKLKRS